MYLHVFRYGQSEFEVQFETTLLEGFPSIDGTIVSGSGSNTCRNFSMGSVLIVDDEVIFEFVLPYN